MDQMGREDKYLGGLVESKPYIGYIRDRAQWLAAVSGDSAAEVARRLCHLYGSRATCIRKAGDSPNEG